MWYVRRDGMGEIVSTKIDTDFLIGVHETEMLESKFSASVYFCTNCKVPVIQNESEIHKCPCCSAEIFYLAKDVRPVFPEERLLMELLLKKNANEFKNSSVWASDSTYYVDGKSFKVGTELFRNSNSEQIANNLSKYPQDYTNFNIQISQFVRANINRLNFIKDEAVFFIKNVADKFYFKQKFTQEQIDCAEQVLVSFSGGKDSTVVSDVVIKALSNPNITHVFGDTTLEFPFTTEYVSRYRNNHPLMEFRIARNDDQSFYDVCEDIGPPARMMRWCCSMFKTGPITRVLERKFGNKQILTFYGIRKCESVVRAKYSRVTENTESVKIQQQTVASPIFYWKDIDIWLYMLGENVDFNDAYRLGYDRVGCWCCPNNNDRAQFLSRIYMPEQSKKWRDFLLGFAKKVGKPDPEEYVDSGVWKARQGGNGLSAAGDVKLNFTNCTSEEHAKIYRLTHKFDDSFLNIMVPFGILAPELGRKLVHEVLVLDLKTKVPIISIQPFNQDGFEFAVKIKTMNVKNHDDLQRKIGYQVKKFNACRKCLKCESICRSGAISIIRGEYYINPDKCTHCHKCVTEKYLVGGCMMDKYLRTRTDYKI